MLSRRLSPIKTGLERNPLQLSVLNMIQMKVTTQTPASQVLGLAVRIISLVPDLEVPIMALVQNLEAPITDLVQVRVLEVPVMGLVQDQVQVVQPTSQVPEVKAPTLVLEDQTLEDLNPVVQPLNPVRVVPVLVPDQEQVLVV